MYDDTSIKTDDTMANPSNSGVPIKISQTMPTLSNYLHGRRGARSLSHVVGCPQGLFYSFESYGVFFTRITVDLSKQARSRTGGREVPFLETSTISITARAGIRYSVDSRCILALTIGHGIPPAHSYSYIQIEDAKPSRAPLVYMDRY